MPGAIGGRPAPAGDPAHDPVNDLGMSTQPQPSEEARERPGSGTPRFNLGANPFAVLGATSRTPTADLQELADRAGTPAAAAAARLLAVPRSRLGAEVSFLPGAADAAPILLAALARGEHPVTIWLPPAAKANILAHLCAAGQATAGERSALVAAQPASGDPALAAAINGDRNAAGVPPLQPAALRTEQDGLTDQHAAAIVASCLASQDAAAELASLVRTAAPGAPATLMRRAAAAWARGSATKLADLAYAADAIRQRLQDEGGAGQVDELCSAVRSWAAMDAPQRAADSRAGLDHEPALRALASWRPAAADLAANGRPDLGLRLARTLADTFDDLPGEAARLQDEVRCIAGQLDDQALERHLAPLRALADQLAAAPGKLQADLAKRPFGPGARGVAGELWSLFDAACRASDVSEAPWTILRALAQKMGGPWHRSGAATAVILQRGLIEKAGASGRTALMGVLAAEQRGLVERALTHDYETKLQAMQGFWSNGLIQRRAALAALRRLLPAVTEPARRAALADQERLLARRDRSGWRLAIVLIASGGTLARFAVMDGNYARNAPYRQPAPPAAPAPVLPGPAPAAPAGTMADDPPPLAKLPVPLPPSAKFPDEQPLPAPAPKLAFPIRLPREAQPQPAGGAMTLPEVTWCAFNAVRLGAAEAAATPRQMPAVLVLRSTWSTLCRNDRPIPRQFMANAQAASSHETRLPAEGRAMLLGIP